MTSPKLMVRRLGRSRGSGLVSRSYLTWNLQRHGVSIERIRRDRVLHEALTARADPLHLALVFGLSHTTASKYTLSACDLLVGQSGEVAREQYHVPGEPGEIVQLSGVEARDGSRAGRQGIHQAAHALPV